MKIGSLVSSSDDNKHYDISVYEDREQFNQYYWSGLTPPKSSNTIHFQTLPYGQTCLVLGLKKWDHVAIVHVYCLPQKRKFFVVKEWLKEISDLTK